MFNITKAPEWVQSAIRQGIAVIGLILTGLNLVEASIVDQLAPLFVALALIIYDVLRTRDLETEKDYQVARALANQDRVNALAQENAKLVAVSAADTAKTAKEKTSYEDDTPIWEAPWG